MVQGLVGKVEFAVLRVLAVNIVQMIVILVMGALMLMCSLVLQPHQKHLFVRHSIMMLMSTVRMVFVLVMFVLLGCC